MDVCIERIEWVNPLLTKVGSHLGGSSEQYHTPLPNYWQQQNMRTSKMNLIKCIGFDGSKDITTLFAFHSGSSSLLWTKSSVLFDRTSTTSFKTLQLELRNNWDTQILKPETRRLFEIRKMLTSKLPMNFGGVSNIQRGIVINCTLVLFVTGGFYKTSCCDSKTSITLRSDPSPEPQSRREMVADFNQSLRHGRNNHDQQPSQLRATPALVAVQTLRINTRRDL